MRLGVVIYNDKYDVVKIKYINLENLEEHEKRKTTLIKRNTQRLLQKKAEKKEWK